MRRFRFPALVVMLVVAGCGGGGASSPSITEPSASSPAATTAPGEGTTATVPVVPPEDLRPVASEPAPSVPSTTSLVVEQPPADLAVLRPDGLSSVDFGTPADEAVATLTDLLGPADLDEAQVAPFGGFDPFPAIDQHRHLRWDRYGLGVELTDWGGSRTAPPVPLHLAMWSVRVDRGSQASSLRTVDGVSIGTTAGELRSLGRDTRLGFDIGLTFSVELASGTMRGQFDWLVFPNGELGRDFVSALQAALNEHGFDLVVDGIWGPRTSAALTEFAQVSGTTQPVVCNGEPVLRPALFATWWLLGLPPADVPISYLAAGDDEVASEPPPALSTQYAILRPDGLGRFDFGDPANDLVSELKSLLGPPSEDTSYTPDGPGPFESLPLGYWAAYELRVVEWDKPDLRLVLSDVGFLNGEWTPTPGTITLVSWETSSPQLTFCDGLAVGDSLVELRDHHPQIGLGTFNVCETGFDPAAFSDTPLQERGLRGMTDWGWVSDLQLALNQRGASLAVDGEYGPNTRAALHQYQLAEGIDQGTAPDANGLIGPDTAAALGLEVPEDARIVRLAAGYPGSC